MKALLSYLILLPVLYWSLSSPALPQTQILATHQTLIILSGHLPQSHPSLPHYSKLYLFSHTASSQSSSPQPIQLISHSKDINQTSMYKTVQVIPQAMASQIMDLVNLQKFINKTVILSLPRQVCPGSWQVRANLKGVCVLHVTGSLLLEIARKTHMEIISQRGQEEIDENYRVQPEVHFKDIPSSTMHTEFKHEEVQNYTDENSSQTEPQQEVKPQIKEVYENNGSPTVVDPPKDITEDTSSPQSEATQPGNPETVQSPVAEPSIPDQQDKPEQEGTTGILPPPIVPPPHESTIQAEEQAPLSEQIDKTKQQEQQTEDKQQQNPEQYTVASQAIHNQSQSESAQQKSINQTENQSLNQPENISQNILSQSDKQQLAGQSNNREQLQTHQIVEQNRQIEPEQIASNLLNTTRQTDTSDLHAHSTASQNDRRPQMTLEQLLQTASLKQQVDTLSQNQKFQQPTVFTQADLSLHIPSSLEAIKQSLQEKNPDSVPQGQTTIEADVAELQAEQKRIQEDQSLDKTIENAEITPEQTSELSENMAGTEHISSLSQQINSQNKAEAALDSNQQYENEYWNPFEEQTCPVKEEQSTPLLPEGAQNLQNSQSQIGKPSESLELPQGENPSLNYKQTIPLSSKQTQLEQFQTSLPRLFQLYPDLPQSVSDAQTIQPQKSDSIWSSMF